MPELRHPARHGPSPPESIEAVLTRLGAFGETPAVAAHGYGPNGDELRGRGLTVHPRLRSQVLADLVSSAMASDSDPEQVDGDALTWINLG